MLDCIIIGAGPAGAAAAYHLAKKGKTILLLEKAPLPRYKPCGGGVSPAVAQWFDFDFSPVIEAKVTKVGFSWQQGDPIEAGLSTEPMWMVQRDRFDHFLVTQAQAAGAQLQDNTPVTALNFSGRAWQVATPSGSLEATYLIVADGANGPCRQWLGLKPPKEAIAAIVEVAAPPPQAEKAQFDFGTIKNGFIWTFPKNNSYAISAGVLGGKGKAEELQKQLLEHIDKLGLNGVTPEYQPSLITLWSEGSPLHTQNALLVGDSAGLADPLLAEGIRPALLSGVKAAEAIDLALQGDANALPQYSQIMQEEWGNDMGKAQGLANLFFKFPKIAYKVAVKRPAAAAVMSKILTGQLRYSDVTEQAVKVLKKSLLPGMG